MLSFRARSRSTGGCRGKSPHDTKERARLEVLAAREDYGLDAGDWQYLTGTFTCGSGDTKAELDEIIARSRELW
jgi:hypothetical protein